MVTSAAHGRLTSTTTIGPGDFNPLTTRNDPFQPADPNSLPTSPSALKQWLERRLHTHPPNNGPGLMVWTGGPEAEALLPQIAHLLYNPTVSPQLRGALFKVAAILPGIIVKKHVTDVDGRVGDAVIASANRGKYRGTEKNPFNAKTVTKTFVGTGAQFFELLINPATTQVLGVEHLNHGQVSGFTLILSSGIVNGDK